MAVFNTVEITIGTEGRYDLSGIFQKGSCGNISETFYKMFEIADSNGFETYSMVSIYFNNPKQVTTDSLLTFMGVFLNDSAETSALSLEGLTRVLPEGDAVYSDLEYRNKMSHSVGPIVNYPALFKVSSLEGWDPLIGYEYFRKDYTR